MRILKIYLFLLLSCQIVAHDTIPFVVVGGGASGIAAGIQAARSGVSTHIFEPTDWLGGMMTGAGVSAFDGNHRIAGGIFKEFRDSLYAYYGGAQAVETGWVSNTLFEPHIGNRIFQNMAAKQPSLRLHFQHQIIGISKEKDLWRLTFKSLKGVKIIFASIVMDATELGDIIHLLKLPSDIGMDARAESGESFAPVVANDIIQDLTYVAVLKDYGNGADKTISKPKNYRPDEFKCACQPDKAGEGVDCETMLQYGRLPGNKYMLNWPNCGNDYYLNLVDTSPNDRAAALEAAKQQTLRFIYFIQQELGYKHLGIAEHEFPTKDGLALIPYHRESRRIKGKVRLSLAHIQQPYQGEPFYRTGIAVGNYPIDHHHDKNINAPKIDFINIKVPAYNVPIGALIPSETSNLIVGEKSISVSNIVNGTTRLQPVVLGIGQAAGALATAALQRNISVESVPIREVQEQLLRANCILMPFLDVPVEHPYFDNIQRLGLCGILRGYGVPFKWANQSWFYPDKTMSQFDLVEGLRPWYPVLENYWAADGTDVTKKFLIDILQLLQPDLKTTEIQALLLKMDMQTDELTRAQIAHLLDTLLAPFRIPIYWNGFPLKYPEK